MAKPNFGYKGSGLTTTDAIAAGATVTTGNYVYLTQLTAVTPSTDYPPMEPDPGSQTALFSNPSALWTTLFGPTTSTSGTASSPYSASFSATDLPEGSPAFCAIYVNPGTLRVTGTVSGATSFNLVADNAQTLQSVGGIYGFSPTAIDWTIPNVVGLIRFDGYYVTASGLTVWLVPNA